MKSEISEKNPYYIPKHRYYELYHFCRQYPMWQKAYDSLVELSHRPEDLALFDTNEHGDPTARCAEAKEYYFSRMQMIGHAIEKIDPDGVLYGWLLMNVTENISYDAMDAKYGMPVSRDEFYKKRREFFWHLSKARE